MSPSRCSGGMGGGPGLVITKCVRLTVIVLCGTILHFLGILGLCLFQIQPWNTLFFLKETVG